MTNEPKRTEGDQEQSGILIAARVILFVLLLPALLIYLIKMLLG